MLEKKHDYLSFTFDYESFDSEYELETNNNYILYFKDLLKLSDEEIVPQTYGKGRFDYMYHLCPGIDLKLKGPINGNAAYTCQLEIKGEGCREIERREIDWRMFLLRVKVELSSKCTRADLAIDDKEGNIIKFNKVKEKLDKHQFVTPFKNKDYSIHGSGKKGYSLNFGSRESTQMLVIYEKDKEQKAKGLDCPYDYWTRYEMRFMHEKADRVIEDIIQAYDGKITYPEPKEVEKGVAGFNTYVTGLFYQLLDIKEDNNYSDDNQYKVNTDPRWLEFIDNVSKVTISKPEPVKPIWNKYEHYVLQTLPMYLLTKYIESKDYYQLAKENFKSLLDGIDSIIDNKAKISQLNSYLKDKNLELVDKAKLLNLKTEIEERYKEEEMPF
jgi:hypothetical protein